jgi:hypothetical protein
MGGAEFTGCIDVRFQGAPPHVDRWSRFDGGPHLPYSERNPKRQQHERGRNAETFEYLSFH